MSKDQHMQKLVLEFQSSGLTSKMFCKQRSVRIHTLAYWLGEIKGENTSSGFIAVSSGMVHASSGFELEYPNGVNIRQNVTSKQAINTLLAFIRSLCAGGNMLQNIQWPDYSGKPDKFSVQRIVLKGDANRYSKIKYQHHFQIWINMPGDRFLI